MFSSMNDLLDHIITHYPDATEPEKEQLQQQLIELKSASDLCIEQWLHFEEKMSAHFEITSGAEDQQGEQSAQDSSDSFEQNEQKAEEQQLSAMNFEAETAMTKGKGYYNLFMFEQAAEQFSLVLHYASDQNLARLFLGMSLMHLQRWQEASRQFQLLIVLTDCAKWLALGYNALGCIQAIQSQIALAEQFFQKAHFVYPQFKYSLTNLEACRNKSKQLSLYFGSTELCCM